MNSERHIRLVAAPEPEIRRVCRQIIADRNARRRNIEFLVVLAVLAAVAFAAGYALGTYDGARYAVDAFNGIR